MQTMHAFSCLSELKEGHMDEEKMNELNEMILHGVSASEGVCIGPAYIYEHPKLEISQRVSDTPELEWARFEEALKIASLEISVLRDALKKKSSSKGPNIFDAHLIMLKDPLLSEAVARHIQINMTADAAVEAATDEISALLSGMDNDLFASRAIDVQDLGRSILRILLGQPFKGLEDLDQPVVLVAKDLAPSDTGSLNPELILGFCTAAGGLTSHTAILARMLRARSS
jgi:phosphoenolpyruvate-protein kinase (PTS system EI component)